MASQGTRPHRGGAAICLLGLLLAGGLAGCNGVIETYRSATGANKNDPDPATAPFNENLDKAEAQPYPNLATVPSAPMMIATTLAERQKLAENLSGARNAVEANGGTASPGPVPPPPPVPPSIAAPEAAGPPLTPKPPTQVARRAMDEPPPPIPQNTTMQTPAIAAVPGAEASRPVPPQGHVQAIPRPETGVLPPAAVQTANPQPAPPAAVLPPPQVSPQVAALPPPKLPPVPTTVTSVDLPSGMTALPGDMRERLAAVVTQYKEKPRTVRIVSYASPGVGGAEQLNNFRAALDRAQLVAKALADAGIPAKQIQTEASPATAAAPNGRIDVQLLP
ncbi:MAG TPA: hypothetical protein VG651_14250 [Stellaceae bacterium]|nr:hypothetical protein [Stellaceae bacterium]